MLGNRDICTINGSNWKCYRIWWLKKCVQFHQTLLCTAIVKLASQLPNRMINECKPINYPRTKLTYTYGKVITSTDLAVCFCLFKCSAYSELVTTKLVDKLDSEKLGFLEVSYETSGHTWDVMQSDNSEWNVLQFCCKFVVHLRCWVVLVDHCCEGWYRCIGFWVSDHHIPHFPTLMWC